ncbi:MAG: kelch repeat-containing protein [Deltaproteobacteria bacterium]|nr:kelch repeat-containing protein [Deltaproteobacteria bacterium]
MRVGLFAVAVLGSCVPAPPPAIADATGRWEQRAPLALGPRQETAVVTLGGEVVVLGGVNELGATLALVEAYDPAVDGWRRLADLPVPLHHANAAVIDGTLVVAGFLVGADFKPDGRVFRYDAGADAWTEGAPLPPGTERGAAGCAAAGEHLYVVGGLRASSVMTVSRYHVVTDTWEALGDLPAALDHLGAYAVDGRITIVGGRTDGLRNHSSQSFELDTQTLQLSARAPMPTSRAGFAGAVVGGEIFIVGGEGAVGGSGVFPQAEAYHPATDSWRSLLDMRTPRHGMGAAAVDDVLYVPGGADQQGFAAVDAHERFLAAPRPAP